ncbi:hypothetical protein MPTK1_2g08180 [Marchantia polymorpha subsp. ruderalis]|uniref:Uncharacterized protein n=1 Tax=Marchantia polymorpha TaxID=3197 RepID=A0A2R6XGR2_MARPO|nr:hypothetical protein MARPO_0015s0103 [Marchantia polymorpha]BBN01536.1 hypothetical protein Mp_2g08180 [Marchantia polymorpha subsp. ruderalis]|eukprot:PTQ45305.1 hypothetical protein MARPO_0015s0103 [Marchantia polymorpha]
MHAPCPVAFLTRGRGPSRPFGRIAGAGGRQRRFKQSSAGAPAESKGDHEPAKTKEVQGERMMFTLGLGGQISRCEN